ncbi:hypothetical protein Tco_0630227 [Tanacetum coccineum]
MESFDLHPLYMINQVLNKDPINPISMENSETDSIIRNGNGWCFVGRAFVIGGGEARQDHNVVMGEEEKDVEEKSKEKRLEDVPVVQDFSKVFLKDLNDFPPTRKVIKSKATIGVLEWHQFTPTKVIGVVDISKGQNLGTMFVICEKNIIMYSRSKEDREEHLKLILELIRKEEFEPILALPEGIDNSVVYCDASHKGLGDVLMQKEKTRNAHSSKKQSITSGNESSGSGNECNVRSNSGDDTDIRPSYDTEPMAKVPYTAEYNVFAIENKHIKQPEFLNDTSLMEKVDSNTTPDSSDMCNNEFEDDQNADDHEDERVVLANLIANLKLDIDENKNIQKQLRKVNASLTHELNECKSALTESNDIWDRCRSALHHKEVELEKYKKYKNLQYDKDDLVNIFAPNSEDTLILEKESR